MGELYSVEAIPERIEFTQERLRQENIHNVHLIQASAMALPLVENSFDLVIANGILEWLGEWDLEDDPRNVQLRFLSTIGRLLKVNGVLVIGIENRFGYGLFLGGNDHSGISYTSLVPRRMASFMLRRSSVPHHRTQLNARREYRTYTYSERGYLKLLTDAGFADVSCRWAEPGYNQPYNLIPLAMPKWVEEQFLDGLDHPGPSPRRSWRRSLKARNGTWPELFKRLGCITRAQKLKFKRRSCGLNTVLREARNLPHVALYDVAAKRCLREIDLKQYGANAIFSISLRSELYESDFLPYLRDSLK